MRKNLFLAGLAAVALTTSCSEDFDLLGNKHEVTLGVSVSAEGTRAAFLSDGSFYWSSGDQIGVTTTNVKNSFTALDLTKGAGTATATFKGTVSGDVTTDCYAIYPYNDGHSIATADGTTTLTYNYPASYTYTKVDQTYFPENKDGNSFNPAMWAKVAESGVTFKYLSGVFCIYVEKVPYASGTLTVAADENLAGKFTAKLSDTTPTCVNTEESPTDASKSVTITFSGATVNSPGVFYVPAPVGKYNNVTLTFKQDDSNTKVIKAGYFEIKRKGLKKLEIKEATIDAGTATTAADASAATTALESNDNVAVTEITAESGTAAAITIPAVTSTSETTEETPTVAENTQKTVTVEKIAESAKIELKDAATSTTETQTKSSVESVTLSIPNMPAESDDEKGKLPEVTVSLPNSTVTLAGNAGAANFGTVTAETAENTLVVSSGVTIQKLIVKKGNVRIEKGATVVAIEKDQSYSGTCTIYYEDGASYPTGLDSNGFTLQQIAYISSENDFYEAMSKGCSIDFTLTKDLTLSRGYTTGQNATVSIDLNKKTLTTPKLIAINGGQLTLKNGNVVQTNGNYLMADNNGTLTIDNVIYTGTANTNSCLFIKQNAQKAKLVVNKSTINGGYYAVTTNASENPIATDCEITLTDSKFIANESGALLNIPAKVTMTNCEFSGNHQGGFLRCGTYTISGCTFTLNAELEATHSENNWMKIWQSGNRGAFAALTIGNYLNTAYQYPTNITFSGTNTATVTGTNASSFPAIHVCANAADDKGVTITNLNNITKSGGKAEVEYGTTNITVDSADPVSYISSESDFTNAMSNGGIYVLKDNVSLSNEHTTTTGKTIAIDLNGKTLTTTNLIRAVGGNLTLNNGSIIQNANATSGIDVGTSGVLSVDKVKYTGQYAYNCFFVIECSKAAKLNISNSTITTIGYGVATNADTTPQVAQDCEINLSNSTFAAGESGTLINIPAKVTMTNCTFSGNHQGGFLRGGTYTISGCTFTLNASLAATHSENNWMKTWQNGNKAAFAALTIGNYLNTAYQYPTTITFTGKNYAKVTGTNASSFPAIHVCANAAEGKGVTITGMSNNVTKSGGKSQSVEYGTTNIKVDGNTVATNISKN